MLIYLDIKIPHLKIAHLGGNLEVGNIKIHQCLKPQTNNWIKVELSPTVILIYAMFTKP